LSTLVRHIAFVFIVLKVTTTTLNAGRVARAAPWATAWAGKVVTRIST